MSYKFEKLEVWQLSLAYTDLTYSLADKLPKNEAYNLHSQITRAATSVALNIAEGSTSQSNAEQSRFIGLAIRSLIETVACLHLIHRRGYLRDNEQLRSAYSSSEKLFAKLQAMRTALSNHRLRDEQEMYLADDINPF